MCIKSTWETHSLLLFFFFSLLSQKVVVFTVLSVEKTHKDILLQMSHTAFFSVLYIKIITQDLLVF